MTYLLATLQRQVYSINIWLQWQTFREMCFLRALFPPKVRLPQPLILTALGTYSHSHPTLPITSSILPTVGAPELNSQLSLVNLINPHFSPVLLEAARTAALLSFFLAEKRGADSLENLTMLRVLSCRATFASWAFLWHARAHAPRKGTPDGCRESRIFFHCLDFSVVGLMLLFCFGCAVRAQKLTEKLMEAGARCILLPTHLCRFVAFSPSNKRLIATNEHMLLQFQLSHHNYSWTKSVAGIC